MYVACPSCQSLYQIELIHLRAAGGELRCGACQTTFNATAAVFDDPQQAIEYANQHPLQESVAREIDDLVNKALDQVSEHEYDAEAADSQSSQAVVTATEETGGTARAEWPDVVSKALEAEHFGMQTDVQAGTSPAQPAEEDVTLEALHEPASGSAAVVDTVEEEALYGRLRADTDFYACPIGAEFRVPLEEKALYGRLQADLDFYACPVTAEFRAQRPQESSTVLELSADFLYAEDDQPAGLHIPWGAIAASILLAVLLLAQFAWVERYQLARMPQLRPALELFCQPLDCDLPLRHDISSIEMVEREVRDHPHAGDALLINASFVNRADFAQAYPVFEVSFSDVSGTPVAVRRFPPAEYLLGRQDVAAGMAPGERAQLMLEVVDPGERAVSFQFDFL